MKIIETGIPDLVVVEPKVFGDSRGYFLETWSKKRYAESGILEDFCQDNMSLSHRGILRGLHMQNPYGQGKLVSVAAGAVYDVAVDLRKGSPTFKRWFGIVLSEEKRNQMFVPKGFAHGFCVLSDSAVVTYKCTDYYNPASEICLIWNDPDIGINWPIENPVVSERDACGLRLNQIEDSAMYAFGSK